MALINLLIETKKNVEIIIKYECQEEPHERVEDLMLRKSKPSKKTLKDFRMIEFLQNLDGLGGKSRRSTFIRKLEIKKDVGSPTVSETNNSKFKNFGRLP